MNIPITAARKNCSDRIDLAAMKCAPVVMMSSTSTIISGSGIVNSSSIRYLDLTSPGDGFRPK